MINELIIPAAMIEYVKLADFVMETLNTDWFTNSQVKELYLLFKRMIDDGKTVNPETIQPEVPANLQQYADNVIVLDVSFGMVKTTLDQMRDAYLEQEIQSAFSAWKEEFPLGAVDASMRLQDTIHAATVMNQPRKYSTNETIMDIMNELQDIKIGNRKGYQWGVPDLDNFTGGIVQGRLYVIAGLKKTGKTLFLLDTLWRIMKAGHKVHFFSLEMRRKEIWVSLISKAMTVDSMRFWRKESVDQRLKDVSGFMSEYSSLPIVIDDRSSPTASNLRSRMRGAVKDGAEVIAIDFIQRTRGDRASSKKHEQMEETVIAMSDVARDYNVPVICLSQVQGSVESAERPTIGSIKDAQAIAENADCLMFLHNPNRNEMTEWTTDPAKSIDIDGYIFQRVGVSNIRVAMKAQLQYGNFYGVDDFHQEEMAI
jgi:replicative DNA helicase